MKRCFTTVSMPLGTELTALPPFSPGHRKTNTDLTPIDRAYRYIGPAIEVSDALPHLTFLSNHLPLQPPLSTTPIPSTSSLSTNTIQLLSSNFQFPILSFPSPPFSSIINPHPHPPNQKPITKKPQKTVPIHLLKKRKPIHHQTLRLENKKKKAPNLRMSRNTKKYKNG